MQQGDDADLTAAVEAGIRRFVFDVQVDWNGNGLYDHPESNVSDLVDSIGLERALTSDLPDEATLLDGYITAKATVALRGRRRNADLTIAQALVPTRQTSPLYERPSLGRAIRVSLGVRTDAGLRWVRQFTGRTSAYDLDPARGEAKLEALDPSDDLREPVTLPFWGQFVSQRARFGPALDVNSQWVIDYIFRRNGIYASPPRPSGTVVSVTCHGGQVAEVGTTRPPEGPGYAVGGSLVNGTYVGGTLPAADARVGGRWTDGPFGMLAFRGSGGQGALPSGDLPTVVHRAESAWLSDTSLGMGFSGWVLCGAGAPGTDGTDVRRLMWSYDHLTDAPRFAQGVSVTMTGDGGVGLRLTGPNGATWNSDIILATAPLKWRFIGVHWKVNTDGTLLATTRADGVTRTVNYPNPGWGANRAQRASLHLSSAGTYSCVTGWLRAAAPVGEWTGETWATMADLGRGLMHLRYLPDVAGVVSRDLIQDVAGAEFAVIGCDEFGRWYFRPRSTATEDTPVAEVTSSRALKDFGMGAEVASVRNVIVSKTHASYFSGVSETIYKAEDVDALVFAPGTRQFDVPVHTDVTPIPSVELGPAAPGGDWINSFGGGYRAVRLSDLVDVSASVRVLHFQWTSRTVRVVVINNSGTTIALADTDSTTSGNITTTKISGAALAISGYKLAELYTTTTTTTDSRSVGRYDTRPLELPDDPWRQNEADFSEVGFRLVHDLAYPVPTLVDVPVLGDPRIQAGDPVRIREPDGLGRPIVARVLTINRTAGKSEGVAETWGLRPSPDTWPV